MDKLEYAEAVVEKVHSKTLRGDLLWECSRDRLSTQPIPAIRVFIKFDDEGPDSAVWEYLMLSHPIGSDLTMVGNPASAKSRQFQPSAAGVTLTRVNEIFRYVLLEPRQKEFEAAMQELRKL